MLHYFIVIGARRKKRFKLRAERRTNESSKLWPVPSRRPHTKWIIFLFLNELLVITRQTRGRSSNVIYILRMSSLRLNSINSLFAIENCRACSAPCDKKMENNSMKILCRFYRPLWKQTMRFRSAHFIASKGESFPSQAKADLFQSLSRFVRRSTASTHWDWFFRNSTPHQHLKCIFQMLLSSRIHRWSRGDEAAVPHHLSSSEKPFQSILDQLQDQ